MQEQCERQSESRSSEWRRLAAGCCTVTTAGVKRGVVLQVGLLWKGDTMNEHREPPSSPQKGQHVRVLTGPFEGFDGTVVDVDEVFRHVWVVVSFFGRETSIRLDMLQVEVAR